MFTGGPRPSACAALPFLVFATLTGSAATTCECESPVVRMWVPRFCTEIPPRRLLGLSRRALESCSSLSNLVCCSSIPAWHQQGDETFGLKPFQRRILGTTDENLWPLDLPSKRPLCHQPFLNGQILICPRLWFCNQAYLDGGDWRRVSAAERATGSVLQLMAFF